jgi:hypothetical protein
LRKLQKNLLNAGMDFSGNVPLSSSVKRQEIGIGLVSFT